MIDFDRQYHILALALRLGKASDFKAVGDEGKENYQFLFSKFISMIEQDKCSFFIEPQKKLQLSHHCNIPLIFMIQRKLQNYRTSSKI